MLENNKLVYIATLISIVALLLSIYGYSNSERVVVFNIKRTYSLFIKQAANPNISQQKRDYLAHQFPTVLTSILHDYARKHHVVIFTSSAVIAGALDITSVVQKSVAISMYSHKMSGVK